MRMEAVLLKDVLPRLRARATFVRRAAYGGVAAFIVVVGVGGASFQTARQQAAMGGSIFDSILWLMLIAGTIECTLLGATSISSERQRNTIDLWILAGMEHAGMVAGKLAAVLARAFSILLAPAVPAAVVLGLGGRSVADASVGFLAIIAIMILAAALSVSVSAFCARDRESVPRLAVAAVAAAAGPAVLLSLWAASAVPGASSAQRLLSIHPFWLLAGLGAEHSPDFVWRAAASLALSCVAALAMVFLAGAYLRFVGSTGRASSQRRGLSGDDRLLRRFMPGLYRLLRPLPDSPDDDPVLWRACVARSGARGASAGSLAAHLILAALGLAFIAAAAVAAWSGRPGHLLFLAAGVPPLLMLAGLLRYCVVASQSFSREVESGQMDLLRLTALDGAEIVDGKLHAFALHGIPWVLMATVFALGMLATWIILASMPYGPLRAWGGIVGTFGFKAVGWALAPWSAAALGLFASLYYARPARALFAGVILYFGPALAIGFFALPLLPASPHVKFLLQTMVGALLLLWFRRWNVEYRGYGARRECMFTVSIASIAAVFAGPVMGAVIVYKVAARLMRANFTALVTGRDEHYIPRERPFALSYQHDGRYSFTHLGVPPGLEDSLLHPERRRDVSGGAGGS